VIALHTTSELKCQDSDWISLEHEDDRMMRIRRSANGQVVFTLSGRMNAEHVDELKALLESEAGASRIILDLRDLTLVDRDAVCFLKSCDGRSIELRNCPAYIREWMTRERPGG
jgi:hypothetical protein